jgi:hypothetical protein
MDAPQANNPEVIVLGKERKERLARAVEEELSATEREIWKLYYDYNLSAADIANLKGTTSGAIRTRLFRTHVKLSEEINREEISFNDLNAELFNRIGIHTGTIFCPISEERLQRALAHEQHCKIFSSQFYRRVARHLREFIEAFFIDK